MRIGHSDEGGLTVPTTHTAGSAPIACVKDDFEIALAISKSSLTQAHQLCTI